MAQKIVKDVGATSKNGVQVKNERAYMTPQQLYDEACDHYKELMLIVRKGGLLLESIKGVSYSTDLALMQIDVVLQHILLTQAVYDGEVDRLERQFIDLITEHGDLFKLINSKCKTELSWGVIDVANNKFILTLLKEVLQDVLDMAFDFIEYFALLDAYIENANYFKVIQNSILSIAECLSWVDGDNSDYNGKELVKIFFGDYYQQKKTEFLQNKSR